MGIRTKARLFAIKPQICFANSPRAHNVRARFLKTRHLYHNKSPRSNGNQNQGSIVKNRAANLLCKFATSAQCARTVSQNGRLCHNKSPCSGGNQNQGSIVNNRAANLLCKFATSAQCARTVSQSPSSVPKRTPTRCVGVLFGAGDGNRTRVFGLGSGHSAIELHLLRCLTIIIQNALGVKYPSAFSQKSFRQGQTLSAVSFFFPKNCGSCASTIATNTRAHPPNSRGVRVLPEMIHPPSAAKTLSRLIVRDATGGAA